MSVHKVLVTGGLGYIGSHTVVELMNAGFEVVIIDNLSNSRLEMLDRITEITNKRPTFEKIDLRDTQALKAFFDENPNLEGVVHFAALKSVGESMQKPLEYYDNNVTALIHLLKEVQRVSIPKFVFSSSCTVYGQPDKLPVDEEAPFKTAVSVYGETKQMCERILQTASSNSGIKVVSLRYFNPIGSHESAKIGEWPAKVPDNLVPYLTQTAVGIRDVLKVFGKDYNTPDGTAIRDYIHVMDLAEAHVLAFKYLNENHNHGFEAFNLGTGKGYSVMDVINSFERVSGQPLRYKVVGRRHGDVEAVYADSRKAWAAFHWMPKRDLDDMMESAWAWQLSLMKNK